MASETADLPQVSNDYLPQIRLSIGLEDPADIVADLRQALDAAMLV